MNKNIKDTSKNMLKNLKYISDKARRGGLSEKSVQKLKGMLKELAKIKIEKE